MFQLLGDKIYLNGSTGVSSFNPIQKGEIGTENSHGLSRLQQKGEIGTENSHGLNKYLKPMNNVFFHMSLCGMS